MTLFSKAFEIAIPNPPSAPVVLRELLGLAGNAQAGPDFKPSERLAAASSRPDSPARTPFDIAPSTSLETFLYAVIAALLAFAVTMWAEFGSRTRFLGRRDKWPGGL